MGGRAVHRHGAGQPDAKLVHVPLAGALYVVWTVVPTTPKLGAPQISWSVSVERAEDAYITYWISITNLTGDEVGIEARYAVLGW